MPANVEKFFGEPVVIAILKGHITTTDMEQVYADTLRLCAAENSVQIYQITDVRQANSSFGDILKILMSVQNMPGSSFDPRIKVVFVGSNSLNRAAKQALASQQFGSMNMPFFVEMWEALDFIRLQNTNASTAS
jgi:hypothetical protein